jgi:hypothetical protein
VLFFPGVFAILAPLGYGLWLADGAYTRYGPVAAEHWSRPWYYLAIVAGAVFLALGIYRIRLSLISVTLHRGGLSVRSGFRRSRNFNWDEIQGIATSIVQEYFFGFPMRQRYQARLVLNSGRTVKLPGTLQNMIELITRLKANLYPRIFPTLLAEFRGGKRLAFGPLAIYSHGLILDNQDIPWHQVKRVDVLSGKLVIEFSDRPARKLPVRSIPNLELVLQLIDQGIPN